MTDTVITTLYIVTMSAWYDLVVYREEHQQILCYLAKRRIEQAYNIEATCITQADTFFVVNKKLYLR